MSWNRCEYTARVTAGEACPRRLRTVTILRPLAIKADAWPCLNAWNVTMGSFLDLTARRQAQRIVPTALCGAVVARRRPPTAPQWFAAANLYTAYLWDRVHRRVFAWGKLGRGYRRSRPSAGRSFRLWFRPVGRLAVGSASALVPDTYFRRGQIVSRGCKPMSPKVKDANGNVARRRQSKTHYPNLGATSATAKSPAPRSGRSRARSNGSP